jgi:PAS domain S-box-containing protein
MSSRRSFRLQRIFTWSLIGVWLLVSLTMLAGALFFVQSFQAGTALLIVGGGLFILSGAATAALIWAARRLLFEPLNQLRVGAERLGQGELDYRLGFSRQDELGALAQALDQMASQLQQHEAQTLAQARLLLAEVERRRSAESEIQVRFRELQQMEAALRESEARFRAVVGNVEGAVYRCAADAEGTIQFISDGFEALTGYPAARFLHQPSAAFFCLILPEDRERVQDLSLQMLRAGLPFEAEYRLQHADGRVIWVLDRARRVTDAGGANKWIDGLILDITRRKHLELELAASRERYELAVLGSTDGLWDWNIAANEVYFSPRWKALLGYADEELPNQFETWTDLLHPDDRPRVLAVLCAYLKGDRPDYRVEFRMRHRDGSYRWIMTRGVGLRDAEGRVYRMAGSHTDITEQKRAEEEILRLNAELEARVRERTAQLEAANAALEREGILLAERVAERTADLSAANAELARAARAKDEFLASMSHELRTPLNTILGMAEALQDQVYGSLTPEQTLSLRNIEESGRHLLALINDLLDISKIEAGKLELNLDELEVAAVCNSSLRLVRPAAEKKRLDVQLEIDPAVTHVRADVRRLKQILVNLLSNAVKFTPEGGALGLAVHAEPEREAVIFTVWDTGSGIAAADLPRLFQPFVQLDSRLARAHVGSGLGLTLVYRMTDLHGGSVSVVSTPGEGSRFSVALPWTPPGDLSFDAAGSGRMAKALLFQPALDPTGALSGCLSELGIWAVPHLCEPGALEMAASLQPPLILLELGEDAEPCRQLLCQLQQDPRTRSIPLIVIADASLANAVTGAEVVVKPVTHERLRSAISGAGLIRRARTGQTGLLMTAGPGGLAPLALIADENEMRLLAQSRLLQSLGYRSAIARNGQEALERALEEPPALILLDVRLPMLDGVTVIRRLRAQPATAHVPILAITTLALSAERERCLHAGATACFFRPVSERQLAAAVRTYAVAKERMT